ncbi:hypothetical protein Tco_1283049, partial [Tanacetum coccineum]
SRLQSKKGTAKNSFSLASTEAVENIKLVQSCNGLLLYTGSRWSACYYVHNPSSNMFKRLLPPDYSHADLFVRHITDPFKCHFVSLDSKLQSRKGTMENSFGLASTEAVENIKLVRSCNGLLLYTGPRWSACYYVYNPSTNMFKRLPPPDYSHADSPYYLGAGLRMAFDPTKSLNYKVVHAGRTSSHIDIQTYCSETINWSLCKDWFSFFSFDHFDSAIYWNGALH